jgi:hypothetical protein
VECAYGGSERVLIDSAHFLLSGLSQQIILRDRYIFMIAWEKTLEDVRWIAVTILRALCGRCRYEGPIWVAEPGPHTGRGGGGGRWL